MTTAFVVVGLVLTLWLPIYPSTVTPPIAVFGCLAAVAALLGLGHERGRGQAAVLLPWLPWLVGWALIGSLRGAAIVQTGEDALPYALFAAGLVAGRVSAPRPVMWAALAVCAIDALVSLARLPSLGADMRSTYFYFRITAGLPLVGGYLATVVGTPRGADRWWRYLALALFVVAIAATVSRGMVLSAVGGVVIARGLRRPTRTGLVAVGIMAVAVAAWPTVSDLAHQYLRVGQRSTIDGRWREIWAALQAFGDAPVLGHGLGARLRVDDHAVSFVHNVIAYHLWKFGLVGTLWVCIPLTTMGSTVVRWPAPARAAALGLLFAIAIYLTTSAAYKTYYLVWIYGVVAGASASRFGRATPTETTATPAPTVER